jgi:hypothetical protein
MKTLRRFLIVLTLSFAIGTAVGCGDDDDDGSGGAAGQSQKAGSGGGGTGGQAQNAGSGGAEADASTGEEPDASTGEEPDASTGEEPDASTGELDIAGSYTDPYTAHEITDETWTQVSDMGTSVFEISQFSNEDGYLIAQNGAVNSYKPGSWSRFDWTEKDGSLWYCQTVYDAETEQDALDAEPADDSDPASGGCGEDNFPWSKLKPE